MENHVVNDKPAIKMYATEITRTDNAVLLDCEGDEHWFPLSTVEINKNEDTVLVQEWKYNQTFK